MSAKPDSAGLIGNHVGHRATLSTVDECDEDSPETSSTPPDETTPLDPDEGSPPAEEDDDVDEPIAVSSSDGTLTDTEAKEALPDGPVQVEIQPEETTAPGGADSGDQSSSSSEDFDPSTIVRRRRDAAPFVGDGVDLSGFKRRAAELGYNDDDDYMDDEGWSSSEDEYIGLIPMLCARCLRCLRRHWFEQRAKHFLVVFNIIFCVRIIRSLH